MTLPEDPMMLFSFINMKLRDNYSSLDELCDDMHLQKEMLVQKLKSAGFEDAMAAMKSEEKDDLLF